MGKGVYEGIVGDGSAYCLRRLCNVLCAACIGALLDPSGDPAGPHRSESSRVADVCAVFDFPNCRGLLSQPHLRPGLWLHCGQQCYGAMFHAARTIPLFCRRSKLASPTKLKLVESKALSFGSLAL